MIVGSRERIDCRAVCAIFAIGPPKGAFAKIPIASGGRRTQSTDAFHIAHDRWLGPQYLGAINAEHAEKPAQVDGSITTLSRSRFEIAGRKIQIARNDRKIRFTQALDLA
ncbi:MAG TPA: hypothetical protein VHC94_18660 [Nitrobacter sp.]|nr:hypothetical protein [Nitrobacter sp.]